MDSNHGDLIIVASLGYDMRGNKERNREPDAAIASVEAYDLILHAYRPGALEENIPFHLVWSQVYSDLIYDKEQFTFGGMAILQDVLLVTKSTGGRPSTGVDTDGSLMQFHALTGDLLSHFQWNDKQEKVGQDNYSKKYNIHGMCQDPNTPNYVYLVGEQHSSAFDWMEVDATTTTPSTVHRITQVTKLTIDTLEVIWTKDLELELPTTQDSLSFSTTLTHCVVSTASDDNAFYVGGIQKRYTHSSSSTANIGDGDSTMDIMGRDNDGFNFDNGTRQRQLVQYESPLSENNDRYVFVAKISPTTGQVGWATGPSDDMPHDLAGLEIDPRSHHPIAIGTVKRSTDGTIEARIVQIHQTSGSLVVSSQQDKTTNNVSIQTNSVPTPASSNTLIKRDGRSLWTTFQVLWIVLIVIGSCVVTSLAVEFYLRRNPRHRLCGNARANS